MKKLTEQDGKSLDMVNENLEALKVIFPEAFTEDGVDFEVLRQLPSLGTLRPCPEESVDWDTTQNLFIEGDNLEVLKNRS
jgi:adenine-specific DNA-methyltransferase